MALSHQQDLGHINKKSYVLGVIILVFTYLAFEYFFVPRAGFVRDEFWFAHHIYQYLHHLPYRDFLPYKPVLGYYVLSIPMLFSDALLAPLFYIKYEISILNAFFIVCAAFWSLRFFKPKAILLTLTILISSQSFLIISSDLRVDMLSSWLGLISVLLVLSNQFLFAGIVLALGFFTSQKVLWFYAATNVAMVIYGLTVNRNKQICMDFLKFNVAMLIAVITYLVIWAHYSSLNTVINSVFLEGYTQSKITWYRQIYYSCWRAILLSGSLFVILVPLTWLSLFIVTADKSITKRRVFITAYSTCMMLLILNYQQAFPYNMVFCVPFFLLLYSDFFSWLLTLFNHPSLFKIMISQRQLFWFIAIYSIFIMGVLISFGIFNAYWLTLTIPICLGLMIFQRQNQHRQAYQTLIVLTIIFTGIIYPLLYTSLNIIAFHQNGAYQKANIKLADDLLREGGEYFAGTPIFYHREQAIPGLMNLIGPAVDYLYKPKPELLPILIASLYLTPRTPQQILHDLKVKRVKLYINNNRIDALPKPIHNYLFSQYQHFWGSIYLYAPQVKSSDNYFHIKFNGTYRIKSALKSKILIDNKWVLPGEKIQLNEGLHTTKSQAVYRLQYLPNITNLDLNPMYQTYAVEKMASI